MIKVQASPPGLCPQQARHITIKSYCPGALHQSSVPDRQTSSPNNIKRRTLHSPARPPILKEHIAPHKPPQLGPQRLQGVNTHGTPGREPHRMTASEPPG